MDADSGEETLVSRRPGSRSRQEATDGVGPIRVTDAIEYGCACEESFSFFVAYSMETIRFCDDASLIRRAS